MWGLIFKAINKGIDKLKSYGIIKEKIEGVGMRVIKEWIWEKVSSEELFKRVDPFTLKLWKFNDNEKLIFSAGLWYGYLLAQSDVKKLLEKIESGEEEI